MLHFLVSLLMLYSAVIEVGSIKNEIVYKNVPEEGRLNFTEKAIKYGYKCEEHTVITEDGYKLVLFHIPGNKSETVFLMHGVIDSADAFMNRGETGLALTLAKEGRDVWAGNHRGNKYSRHHITYDPKKDKKKFWDFALEELAVYDLPAMLDYVLNATGQTKLHAFGHSQGNALFYILGAEKPEYNEKFKLFVALAPICYLHHTRALAKTLLISWPLISSLYKLVGTYEILPKALLDFKTVVCSKRGLGYNLCAKGIFFPLAGSDPEQLEPEFFPVVIGRYPDTGSIKNGDHLAQIGRRKKFSKYDYGTSKNREKYGSSSPPDYDLKKVNMPIALIAAKNDNLSSLKDVVLLKDQLPNVVKYHVMDRKEFNHIDYVWGNNMTELYSVLFSLLEEYP